MRGLLWLKEERNRDSCEQLEEIMIIVLGERHPTQSGEHQDVGETRDERRENSFKCM